MINYVCTPKRTFKLVYGGYKLSNWDRRPTQEFVYWYQFDGESPARSVAVWGAEARDGTWIWQAKNPLGTVIDWGGASDCYDMQDRALGALLRWVRTEEAKNPAL